MTDAPYLFISHASVDVEYTDYLASRLRAAGYACWVDSENLPTGSPFAREIEKGVAGCGALIVIMSAAAKASEWVEREVLLAFDLNKPVYVALFEEVALPIYAVNRQFGDFRKRRDAGMKKLLAALAARPLTEPAPATPQLSPLPNDANYFKYLEKTYSAETAQIARGVYGWMRANCDNVSFSGRREPAVHAHVYVGPGGVLIASLRAHRVNPALELPLVYLVEFPPYDQRQERAAIVDALNALLPRTQQIAPERADRRPSVPLLPTLGDPAKRQALENLLGGIVDNLRKISPAV